MANKVAIEVEIKNIKELSKLKKELSDLRKEMKATEKETADGAKLGKKAAKQYSETATKVKNKSDAVRKLNKNLRDSNTTTKNVTKSNNGMAKQFVKGAAAIGIIVGAFRAVNRVVSSVVTTFSDFEFVMAKVNAVSGSTEREFAALTKTAEELGRTTFFTATQVGELMLNFSKLGFTANEIQAAVQPTLDLATATGSDLARAALVAGAAVRGFALDADETQRVVDVMAVSFSSSAMNIEKWQTSMTKVAPIAKAAGFSIEDTAAIMSKLTDSGIEASIAGTSLRNILLKMQDPSSDLTKAFGGTIHSLDQLVPAMKKFVAEGGSMADIMEVVDLRQAAAFEQMLTTADGTLELRDALLDASGEGKRMADIVGNTLQGAFLKFTSALQGLSIGVMKGFAESMTSTVETAAKFFNVLAENSKTIANTVRLLTTLVKKFVIYKAVVFAASGSLKSLIVTSKIYTALTVRMTALTTGLTFSMKGLKLAVQGLWSATGFGLLIVALSEIVPWLIKTKDATKELMDETEKITKSYFESLKPIEELKVKTKELIRIKGLMNDMVDKEGNLLDNTAINQKVYNKFKGQAAILTRNLNFELKKNDQALITEKTSIEGVAKAIDVLTSSLMNQALVKGFQQQIEKIAEVAANAEVAKQELISSLGVSTNELFEAHGVTLDELLDEAVAREKNFAITNKILEDAGFETWEDLQKAMSGSAGKIDAVQKAFDDLAGEGGISGLILKTQVYKGKVDDLTVSIDKNTKSVKENFDAEAEIVALLMDQGVRSKQEQIRVTEFLNKLREKEIKLQLKSINKFIMDVELRKKLLAELSALTTKAGKTEEEIDAASQERKDESFQADVKRAIMSGQTAEEAMKTVVRAQIMEAVAGFIASIFKSVPFPFNLILAAGASAAIGNVIDSQLAKFSQGGVVETFADGGMVQGKSHAHGGEKFAVGGRVVELEGGEAVINKRSTAMYRGELSAMNSAGGGVKFADGGLLNSPAFAQQQFSGMRNSGGGGAQKVFVVESDISQSQHQVSVLEANATL